MKGQRDKIYKGIVTYPASMSKINVEVPDPVVLALRKHVVDKYGSMRGMGKVVEEALRDYLTKSNVSIEV